MWFTTTAWMMWNALVSTLLLRASIVMLDGNPLYPDPAAQWRLAERTRPTLMGAGPALLMGCRKAGLQIGQDFDLSSIRQLCAAGSPLPAEGYDWVYEQLGPDLLLNVGSGGTDVCCGIVQGSPLQPVYRGEIAGRCLAVDTAAFDPDGNEVVGELGELVIRQPMPSMPVRFWNDPGDERYRAAYFDEYPGVWRHGDWILFTERGSCVITGRSDATLNRGGVRMGTAEFYSVVEEQPEVEDSLVVHLEDPEGGPGELLLFVALREGSSLDDDLRKRLAGALRGALSPRHVPDTIEAVPAIPRTLTGKKLELPVKRILLGAPRRAGGEPRRARRPGGDRRLRRVRRGRCARRRGDRVRRAGGVADRRAPGPGGRHRPGRGADPRRGDQPDRPRHPGRSAPAGCRPRAAVRAGLGPGRRGDRGGDGVTSRAGDRVVGMIPFVRIGGRMGAYAEAAAMQPAWLAPLAPDVGFEVGATLPLNALTAREALAMLALPAGATLLITGAGGAVGGFATQLAAAAGRCA